MIAVEDGGNFGSEIVVIDGNDLLIQGHKMGYCYFLWVQMLFVVIFSIFVWDDREGLLLLHDVAPKYFLYAAANMAFYFIQVLIATTAYFKITLTNYKYFWAAHVVIEFGANITSLWAKKKLFIVLEQEERRYFRKWPQVRSLLLWMMKIRLIIMIFIIVTTVMHYFPHIIEWIIEKCLWLGGSAASKEELATKKIKQFIKQK